MRAPWSRGKEIRSCEREMLADTLTDALGRRLEPGAPEESGRKVPRGRAACLRKKDSLSLRTDNKSRMKSPKDRGLRGTTENPLREVLLGNKQGAKITTPLEKKKDTWYRGALIDERLSFNERRPWHSEKKGSGRREKHLKGLRGQKHGHSLNLTRTHYLGSLKQQQLII